MTDQKTCPHDRFTATSDKKFMECNECSRSFSTDLYWGVYDQLEYGKDQGCGEEAIEVIQMVEDHHEEQRREQMNNIDQAVHAVTYDPANNSFTYLNVDGETLWTKTAELQHIAKMRPHTPSLERINHYWKGQDPR